MSGECLACGLMAGRVPLPGGCVLRTEFWVVEHCVGPLGLGTQLRTLALSAPADAG
ncbi:hypothetical protein ABZ619_19740 [Streptomyces sp. NPDC007851]|uniref:hypothetical protein n=1 Tax=Streptomyces sp. NPDC007851 TaxID=3155008 RepID=UPI0033D8909D